MKSTFMPIASADPGDIALRFGDRLILRHTHVTAGR